MRASDNPFDTPDTEPGSEITKDVEYAEVVRRTPQVEHKQPRLVLVILVMMALRLGGSIAYLLGSR